MKSGTRRGWSLFAAAVGLGASLASDARTVPTRTHAVDAAGEDIDFGRDVRPILAGRCYACHGPDAHERKAGLRLDVRPGAEGGGFVTSDGTSILAPGDPDGSELLFRVATTDASERMPPPDFGTALEPAEIEILERWIAAGAPWSGHWSFTPPRHPAPPEVSDPRWCRDPLDRFILARLDAEGLAPSPEADRETLIRRLSLDLNGLPPTLEEIDAFVADTGDDAYERLARRLLDSPRYGERMALWWLDLARYADTNGYSIDGGRHMWAWRDWVIEAFNQGMPFDAFTVEQLAGDLLPDATLEQRIASGFNRNHMITHEGGTIEEEYRVAYVVDRVKTTAQTWMGLTLGCAQCHDHKYEPITQEEYYRFFAYFNTIADKGNDGNAGVNSVPFIPVPSAEQWVELDRLALELAVVEAELARVGDADAQREWERELLASAGTTSEPRLGPWSVAGPIVRASGDEAFDTVEPPGAGTGDGAGWRPAAELVDGVVHELPGENAATFLARTIAVEAPTAVRVSLGSDDAIKLWLNGERLLESRVQRGVEPGQEKLTLHLAPGENRLLLEIVNYGGPGGFFFDVLRVGPPPALLDVIAVEPAARDADAARRLRTYYLRDARDLQPIRDRMAPIEERMEAIRAAAPTTAMVMEEMEVPRDTRVLERGQYDRPLQLVEPGTPACLSPLPADAPANRLGLARWLIDPAHPLTARVTVNGLWQLFFGLGLVETSEDFGTRGAPPSHPELLDLLARDFVDGGWDVKALVLRLVTSSTYRQSSRVPAELLTRDPRNRLLARGPRFRLAAELVRDNALAVAGLLVERVGGPSVKPYQPPGLWREMSHFGSTPATEQMYEQGSGEDLWRRSLYTVHKRTVPPPAMAVFDAPNRELCSSRRLRTNTPLQALVVLNDPTFVEAARGLAQRMMIEGGRTLEQRVRFGFRLATAHEPSPDQLALLVAAFDRERRAFADDPDAALALLGVGESPRADLDPTEHAAWTVVASTLLNLSETLTRG